MAYAQHEEHAVVRTTRRPPSVYGIIVGIINFVFGAIEVILGFQFFLRLFDANPDAAFTEFIYNIAEPFIAPFRAVFAPTSFGEGSVFAWGTLLAMAVYAVIAWGLVSLVNVFATRAGREISEVEREDEAGRGPLPPEGPA